MKPRKLLTPLLIFGTFMLMGIWMGRMLAHSLEAEQLAASSGRLPDMVDLGTADQTGVHSNAPLPAESLARVIKPNQEPVQFQKQRNVLLIGVDDLRAVSPSLEGAWLILYIPDLPQISWMPVYPQVLRGQDGIHIEAKAEIREAYAITANADPSQAFLNVLEEEGIWWDYYIVIDQKAVIELIDSLGGIDSITPDGASADTRTSGTDAFSDLRSTKGNLQEALISQANLIQQLCRVPPESYLDIDRVVSIYQKLDQHMKTDITPHEIVERLQGMANNGGRFVCDFPSLVMLSESHQ